MPWPPLEKNSPCGCHTILPQFAQRIVWLLYPTNCLLQAGHAPLMTILLAIAVSKRGPAKGNTHVANIKKRNNHPDRANQIKKIVAKLLPIGVSRKSLNCFLYLGQFLLKSREKVRQRWLSSNSRSSTRARSAADCATEESRRETEYRRSMLSAVFFVSYASCSKLLLALRHTSLHVSAEVIRLAKLSRSLRLKAWTVGSRLKDMYCL